MRLSSDSLKALKELLTEQTGKTYDDEELQKIGLAIVRFIVAKNMQNTILNKKVDKDE